MKMLAVAVTTLTLSLTAFGQYKYSQINPFGSIETSARGINDNGAIVGDFATTALQNKGSEQGYLLSHGSFFKIIYPGATDTDAQGINSEGVILGMYDYRNDGVHPNGDHGFLLDQSGYHPLPDPVDSNGLPIGNAFPDFNGINENSDVVGVLSGVPGTIGNRGFLLPHGATSYTVLDCGQDQTEANGIDSEQDIVGECTTLNPNHEHAFFLPSGSSSYFVFDYPGAVDTIAWGISDDGEYIVGQFTDINGNDHGYIVKDLMTNPKFTIIDMPGAQGTSAKAVNDHGQVVGVATFVGGKEVGFTAKKRRREE